MSRRLDLEKIIWRWQQGFDGTVGWKKSRVFRVQTAANGKNPALSV
jgi:hypothetical protein